MNCSSCALIWTGRCNCREHTEAVAGFFRDRVHEMFSEMVQDLGVSY